MEEVNRRQFFTRAAPAIAALVGTAAAAAPSAAVAASPPLASEVSARDLRRMSRAEVKQALRRIAAKRRAR